MESGDARTRRSTSSARDDPYLAKETGSEMCSTGDLLTCMEVCIDVKTFFAVFLLMLLLPDKVPRRQTLQVQMQATGCCRRSLYHRFPG